MNAITTVFHHLLYMGGFGFYVWSAYGFTLLAFGFNLFMAIRRYRKILNIVRSEG